MLDFRLPKGGMKMRSVQHSMKLPALSDGAGGAPALLFPILPWPTPGIAKMHGRGLK